MYESFSLLSSRQYLSPIPISFSVCTVFCAKIKKINKSTHCFSEKNLTKLHTNEKKNKNKSVYSYTLCSHSYSCLTCSMRASAHKCECVCVFGTVYVCHFKSRCLGKNRTYVFPTLVISILHTPTHSRRTLRFRCCRCCCRRQSK